MKTILLVLLGSTFVACGFETSLGDAAVPDDAGGDAASGPDTLSFQVLQWLPTSQANGPALTGVVVAVDAGTGVRTTQATGVDGVATFTGMNWRDAPFDIVFAGPGFSAGAWVDLSQAEYDSELVDGHIQLTLSPIAHSTVTVHGAIAGLDSRPSIVQLQSTSGGVTSNVEGNYWLAVQSGVALRIVSFDYHVSSTDRSYTHPFYGWSISDEIPAPSGDVVHDVDFTMSPVASHTARVTLALPHGAAGSFFATATVLAHVYGTETTAVYGSPNALAMSADESHADMTLEWVDPPGAAVAYVYYGMLATGASSYIVETELPVDGSMRTLDLLTPPFEVGRTASGFPHLHDTVVLHEAPPADVTPLVVITGSDGVVRYRVRGAPGSATVRVPELPMGADPTLFMRALVRETQLCRLRGIGPTSHCTAVATADGGPIGL